MFHRLLPVTPPHRNLRSEETFGPPLLPHHQPTLLPPANKLCSLASDRAPISAYTAATGTALLFLLENVDNSLPDRLE
ncbi:uncharacterized protein K444DRAFT_621317 [Hyaloscypha bicolor E]|uniref:Uncharacterized protein n=1 Tax=Hyaloscypha bicolor E TaxID=1095630 RepID=A0A2J6SN22_9HELO|nr:uncharacterized protein K444DRAFT_621317 [Hyaloscypha bicolor E]PMD52169.1 hypothetical protein K444DRAFT_621317 [Hyaloscypha bicolor E]